MLLKPSLSGGLARETAPDMVVHAAERHVIERCQRKLQELRNAGAQMRAPEKFDQAGRGEFRSAGKSAIEYVEALTDANRRLVENAGIQIAAQVARPEIGERLLHAGRGVGDRIRLLAIEPRHFGEDALER